MPRAIWTGSLSFGLVNVPVGLFTATEDKTIRFNQFQAGTLDRVRQKRVNERTGDDVEYSDIVKGYDLGGGEYVMVTPEELESVEPGRSRTIEITDFVDLGEIDPIHYKSSYYIGPQGEQAVRAYALLRKAMEDTNKVAIASFVLRSKEHLVAVRPMHSGLVLETMFYADEIRDPATEIGDLPADTQFTDREVKTAKLLVESMTSKWDSANYQDEYRQRVEQLIDEKGQGKVVVTERPATQPTPVVDLMAALQASVEAARSHQPGTRLVGESPGAGRAASPPSRSSKRAGAASSPTEGLSSLSKSELMARASELGVPGRSKMTREELEVAVASAAKPVRRRKAS
jgi:DNA end-binding protein Ku